MTSAWIELEELLGPAGFERALRERWPQFPWDAFRATPFAGQDAVWLAVYGCLWETVRGLGPRRIVEIGVRAGQSAWTMLDACPDATLVGFDLDADTDGGYRGSIEDARRLLPPERVAIHQADSHRLTELPDCDLVYIDGDHSLEGALADLRLAALSTARSILVDDSQIDAVRDAVAAFLAEAPGWEKRHVPSPTGLYVLSRLPAC